MKIDFNQPLTLKPLTAHAHLLGANLIVIIAIVSVLLTLGLLISTLSALSRQPQNITATQLLNQRTIEEAINLLQTQTVTLSTEP